jgi:hypothetical protein
MAGAKLDAAGAARLKTLEEALLLLQRLHGLVEAYALAVKRNQPTSALLMNLRRQFPTLAENLKSQFGTIADQVTTTILTSTRGASEAMRVRNLREGVAQIRQSIDVAVTQTRNRHTVEDTRGDPGARPEADKPDKG